MIEALKATLAPFAKCEKPQLSTSPAASFIKNGPCIGGVNAFFASLAAPHEANSRRRLGLRIHLFLLAFRDDWVDRRHYRRLPPTALCTRWNDAAHIRSSRDLLVSICFNRYNYATGIFRRSSDVWRETTDRGESAWAGR
jgi:hypothetical protein